MDENYEYDGKTGLSKLNQAGNLLNYVSTLQYNATESYMRGDIEKWYYYWTCIPQLISGKIKEEEYVKLKAIESKINFVLARQSKNEKYKAIAIILINSYLRYIQNLMDERGMGLVEKEDETIFA